MGVLYIVGTGPRCGKTALAAGLALAIQQQGIPPLVLKPLSPAGDADNSFYRRLIPDMPNPEDLPLPSPTDVLPPPRTLHTLRTLAQKNRPVILEGVDISSPDSPLAKASATIVAETGARVAVIASYRPDMKSEDLVPARTLFGERLLGVVINGVWRYQGHRARTQIAPALERAGLRVLGLVPEDRRMVAPTVEEVARCVEGEIRLFPEKGEALVEAIMVGGWPLDEGAYVFSRLTNKAVVVRADRPDLHMAALATSTVCLVLTAGVEPVQYTVYEAEQAGIPLVWTHLSTLQVLERLEGVASLATVRVPAKAQYFAELLAHQADLSALQAFLTSG